MAVSKEHFPWGQSFPICELKGRMTTPDIQLFYFTSMFKAIILPSPSNKVGEVGKASTDDP